MALNFFILLTLMKFGLSAPDPNINVNVNIQVEDDGNNCCGDKSCTFGGVVYLNKSYLKDKCIELQCCDGTWKYKGINEKCCNYENILYNSGETIPACMVIKCNNGILEYQKTIQNDCGTCIAWGDPHIIAFDNHISGRYYPFNEPGTFVITQQNLASPNFKVISKFEKCSITHSCVKSATYSEPGMIIKLEVPVIVHGCKGVACKIKVTVNSILTKITNTITRKRANQGEVLIFDDIHIPTSNKIMDCINIVGSNGMSVSLCTLAHEYALLHVWLLPSLKNEFYGMCDRFTGTTLDCWMESDGSCTTDITSFTESWQRVYGTRNSREAIAVNKCEIETVLLEIQEECNYITAAACELMKRWECVAFKDACVFDLCAFSNHTLYAEGYAKHMLIHSQLAHPVNQSTSICR